MPLRGNEHSPLVSDQAPYFTSLAALDEWADSADIRRPLSGVLRYKSRSKSSDATSQQKGKLLVDEQSHQSLTRWPLTSLHLISGLS